MSRLITLTLCIALATGCQLATPEQPVDPANPVDPMDPMDPADLQPTDNDPAGTYHVVNEFDLTVSAVLPGTLYTYVSVLADLRDDPAGTLFDLLAEANVPLLSDLLDVLPSELESQLIGWLNEAIASTSYQDGTAIQAIDSILAMARVVLTRFDLISELELPALQDASPGQAAHQLHALGYRVGTHAFEIAIVNTPLFVTRTTLAASITPQEDRPAELGLDLHSFGLPYGEYAYQALEYAVTQQHGMGIRDTLGAIINCPAVAASVADKCALGVCVGHEAELSALCELGLDLAVEELRSRLYELRFDAVELDEGKALLAADPEDPDGVLIAAGTWQSRIDIGTGLRRAPARFSGSRLP
jgi:hypothetical protein